MNIAVLQNAQNINPAKASVQTLDGEWTEIGVFDKAWKVFEINNSILAFKLSFEGTMDVGMQEIIVYGGADYIKVVEALEKVPEDLSIYTEETVKAVTDAVEAVIYGKEAMEHLSEIGVIVYLRATFDTIDSRLGNLEGRGVAIKSNQTLFDLYQERTILYEKYADAIVDLDGCSISATVVEIERILQKI